MVRWKLQFMVIEFFEDSFLLKLYSLQCHHFRDLQVKNMLGGYLASEKFLFEQFQPFFFFLLNLFSLYNNLASKCILSQYTITN